MSNDPGVHSRDLIVDLVQGLRDTLGFWSRRFYDLVGYSRIVTLFADVPYCVLISWHLAVEVRHKKN